MPSQKHAPKKRWHIIFYFYLVLILLSLLVVASYTWFSISQTPRVSDLNLYVNAPTGLQLSGDILAKDEDWVLQLDFQDLVPETAPLRPVTWSDAQQKFFRPMHGMDGRLMPYGNWPALTDEEHASTKDSLGFYIKATFYARTDYNATVSLSPAVEVDEGIEGSGTYVIGTPVWDDQNILHNNGGQGAECAIRIGFKLTPVDKEGNPLAASDFYIYEPNSDLHIEQGPGYTATPSIDGTPNLTMDSHLILQTASTWTEAYPVERDVVIHEMGEFTTPTELFTLDSGEYMMIDLYIWLEGQDVDCISQIDEAQILASIQFAAEPDEQSGMVPIE